MAASSIGELCEALGRILAAAVLAGEPPGGKLLLYCCPDAELGKLVAPDGGRLVIEVVAVLPGYVEEKRALDEACGGKPPEADPRGMFWSP